MMKKETGRDQETERCIHCHPAVVFCHVPHFRVHRVVDSLRRRARSLGLFRSGLLRHRVLPCHGQRLQRLFRYEASRRPEGFPDGALPPAPYIGRLVHPRQRLLLEGGLLGTVTAAIRFVLALKRSEYVLWIGLIGLSPTSSYIRRDQSGTNTGDGARSSSFSCGDRSCSRGHMRCNVRPCR